MTDTLTRIAGPTSLSNAAATVYTTPAATTTSITNVHVANESGATATFTLSIGADAAGKRYFYQINIFANDVFDWTGLIVLAATEIIQAYSGTNAVLTLTMSGVQVT
jgi:hypothetical protein